MAEDDSVQTAAAENGEPIPATGARRSLLARLKVLLFVAVVIAVECSVAYLYLPAASDTAAMAGVATPPTAEGKPAAAKKNPEEPDQPEQVEVDLGEFSVTSYQGASNSTLRIDFHLYGTVAGENHKDFVKRMDENKQRFREQVLVTARSASTPDLTDAGLGLLKRRILDKTNHILGKPLLKTVVVSDFSFIEQ